MTLRTYRKLSRKFGAIAERRFAIRAGLDVFRGRPTEGLVGPFVSTIAIRVGVCQWRVQEMSQGGAEPSAVIIFTYKQVKH